MAMVVCATIFFAVAVAVIVIVIVIVTMDVVRAAVPGGLLFIAVTLREHLLCERIVFGKRGIVPMAMAAAVCAGFRMKRQGRALDVYAQPAQHRFENGIGCKFQIIRADFHGGMAIAEVVGRPRERERVARAYDDHRLGGGDDAHERTVVGDEDVCIGEHGAARHDECDCFARIERGREPALAPFIVGKRQGRRACNERRGEFRGRGNTFVDRSHRKYIQDTEASVTQAQNKK